MSQNSRWQPTIEQVKTPEALHRTLKQVLEQHYALQDRFNDLHARVKSSESAAGAPQGPATTKLLGLNVEPVDTQALADGAALKFVKARGTFRFS